MSKGSVVRGGSAIFSPGRSGGTGGGVMGVELRKKGGGDPIQYGYKITHIVGC